MLKTIPAITNADNSEKDSKKLPVTQNLQVGVSIHIWAKMVFFIFYQKLYFLEWSLCDSLTAKWVLKLSLTSQFYFYYFLNLIPEKATWWKAAMCVYFEVLKPHLISQIKLSFGLSRQPTGRYVRKSLGVFTSLRAWNNKWWVIYHFTLSKIWHN